MHLSFEEAYQVCMPAVKPYLVHIGGCALRVEFVKALPVVGDAAAELQARHALQSDAGSVHSQQASRMIIT